MRVILKKVSLNDGEEFYNMLQALPMDENGFYNTMAGKSFAQFKAGASYSSPS